MTGFFYDVAGLPIQHFMCDSTTFSVNRCVTIRVLHQTTVLIVTRTNNNLCWSCQTCYVNRFKREKNWWEWSILRWQCLRPLNGLDEYKYHASHMLQLSLSVTRFELLNTYKFYTTTNTKWGNIFLKNGVLCVVTVMFFLLGTFACCTSACAHWVSCRVVSWIHRWLMFWPLCSASPGGDVSLPPPATAPKDVLKAENCASSVATTGGFDGPLWALLSHTSCMWSWIPDLPTKPLAFHWVDGGGPASLLALCLNSAASSEYFIFISSAELQKPQCQSCPRSIWSPSIFPRHFMLFFFSLCHPSEWTAL